MSNRKDGRSPVDWMRAKTGPPGGRGRSQFPGMREYRRRRWQRVKGLPQRANCFHVMSRIVDGLEFFDDEDKEAMVVLLFKMARFCRVKVLTYCVMGNHFHALIEVPDGEKARATFRDEDKGWERLYAHLGCLYSKAYVAALKRQVDGFLEAGRCEEAEEIREAFLQRMGDLSRFMWELKERYTKWYNKTHGRRGALWMGRFKSVLVQGREDHADADGGYSEALRTVAAYIDLNPVRAELVEDPADYRWSGYAAALAGQRRARRGINQIMGAGTDRWEEDRTAEAYRRLLSRHGLDVPEKSTAQDQSKRSEPGKGSPDALCASPEAPAGGQPNLVRHSMRAMSRGFALGSRSFLEEIFKLNREHFGEKRKSAGRKTGLHGLFALRKIRRE